MEVTLKPVVGKPGNYAVHDSENELLADLVWHDSDWSFGLRIHGENKDTWAQQRYVRSLEAVEERIKRIYDETPLKQEIETLTALSKEEKKLRDEKYTTTNGERYKELTTGLVLRDAEIATESQADIVNAKLRIMLGIGIGELRELGVQP